MQMRSNTILVTGGASGIGLALAERFLALGNRVIVCGRDPDRLAAAQAREPRLEAVRADIATLAARERLAATILDMAPDLNVLINNAGIQRRGSFTADDEAWSVRAAEIAINFEAPVHLIALLLPHLREQANPAIINVSSGLAFLPVRFAPVYAATKAALHSFTVALRAELKDSTVDVVEVVPPMVRTDLGGEGVHGDGVPLDDFADAVVERMAAGDEEIGYGQSETFRKASPEEVRSILAQLNA